MHLTIVLMYGNVRNGHGGSTTSRPLVASLAQARLQQGLVFGRAQAVGISGEAFAQVVNEIWVQEVIATAAIEGQKLDFDQVRSIVMR